MKKNINNTETGITRRESITLGIRAAAAVVVGSAIAPRIASAKSSGKIGFAMETFTVSRWKYLDKPNFESAVKAGGFDPIVVQANFDVTQQMSDVENLLSNGVGALALVAITGKTGVSIVQRAKAAGVPVVAYNNELPSGDVAAFVARNNRLVGRKAVEAAKDARVLSGNWVIVSGEPGGGVSTQMTQGYHDALQPLIDSGKVKIVSEIFHEGWSPETARRQAEDALTVTKDNISGFLCNNDGMAGGVITALEAAGVAGKVFVSGMDATSEACRQIVLGKMTLSSFTRFDVMGKTAGEVCVKLANKEKIQAPATVAMGNATIPYFQIEDFNVTKQNVIDYIRQYSPDYVDAKAVFQGVPKDLWPAGAEEFLR